MQFRFGKHHKISLSIEIIIPLMVILFTLSYYFQVTHLLSSRSLLFAKPLLFLCFTLSLFIFYRYGIKVLKIKDYPSSTIGNHLSGIDSIFSNKKSIEVMVVFLTAILIMEKLGFIITTFLYLIFLMHLLGRDKIKYSSSILIALSIVSFLYFLFQFWLHVPLPTGVLEGLIAQ